MDYRSLDSYVVTNRGRAFVVAAPFDITDRAVLHGEATIDGDPVTVVGVETHAIPVVRAGTPIGLLVA